MPTDSYLLLNDLRFHYRYWGGDGPPAVLLHGLASNARIWDLVAPLLAGPLRVYALDQRGHGLSDPAPAEDAFDFPGLVRDVQAFVEALDLTQPLLIGHSWGAHVALHYAATRSFGPAAPGAIVLVDGGVMEMTTEPGLSWEVAEALLRPPDLDGMPREVFLERLRGWLGDLYSETVAQIVLTSFGHTEEDTLYRRLPVPQHMRIAHALYEHRPSELFSRLRCPALLCPALTPPGDGSANALFLKLKGDGVARAEQASPLVRTVWFENTLHDIPLHRPAELARTILDFYSSTAQL